MLEMSQRIKDIELTFTCYTCQEVSTVSGDISLKAVAPDEPDDPDQVCASGVDASDPSPVSYTVMTPDPDFSLTNLCPHSRAKARGTHPGGVLALPCLILTMLHDPRDGTITALWETRPDPDGCHFASRGR